MSPSAEYEPVPAADTEDTANTQPDAAPPPPPQKVRSRLVTVRRLLLFSLTILCVSFAAFKSGEWSAQKALLQQQPEAQEHTGEDIAIESPVSAANDTDVMSGGGKYSVG